MTAIKGKTVLVTGAARGLGKLMCEESALRGAKEIIMWDIDEETLNTTANELAAKGHSVHPYVVDVTDVEQIEWAASDIKSSVGTVDILFNNAGIVVGKSFVEHTDADIEKTIAINVLGVMRVAKAFLSDMIAQKSCHIINIASAAGMIANPNMSVYASSKWAVLGWSESLRLELEEINKNLRVLTVTPSYINTGMFDGVKAPMLTPIMEPDKIVARIMKAVEKNEILLRAPFVVNAIPMLKGILPTRVFDYVAGDLMGVYESMDKFKGHDKAAKATSKKDATEEAPRAASKA